MFSIRTPICSSPRPETSKCRAASVSGSSRAKTSPREEALLLSFHGGLIYQLGIWPLIYQQHFSGEGDAALIDTFIRDRIRGYLAQMGDVALDLRDWTAVHENPFFCPDPARVPELEALITQLRRDGDSVGARVTVLAQGVPPGLGEPVFDRLDADIAHAMMGINAVKGVEIGAGFDVVTQKGSEHRDEITSAGFLSNRAGGVLGGISSGQDVVVSLALKPTSSIRLPGRTVDVHGADTEIVTTGRHDPCVGIRAVPIAEAMLALVLMDHLLRQQAQNSGIDPVTPVIPGAIDD